MKSLPIEQSSPWHQRILDIAWLLGVGLATSIWCLAAAPNLGATFDEPAYLKAGLVHWRTHSSAELMRLGTMPLPIDLQTLPLYLAEQWRGQPIDVEAEIDRVLPWARAATLPFWWLLLFYAWRAGRSLAGPWGGRLAPAIIAVEPVLLSHAALATTDIAVTACLLVFLVEFQRSRTAPWPRRLALPALLFGLALLAKASALAFGIIGMLVIATHQRTSTGRAFRETATITAGALVVVLLYCGSDWRGEPDFIEWARHLPNGARRETMTWVAENLRIFSNGGEALVRQIAHNFRGHSTYLLGQVYPRAIWFYFPVALTIKSSLLLLLLPIAIACLRARSLLNWPCLTAAVLLLFSLTSRVQIGVRFMFPLMALAAIGLAAASVNTLATLKQTPARLILLGFVSAGLLWNVVLVVALWPNTMAYTNALWGGTARGHRWLVDSNNDWGQGLPELREWQQNNGGGTVALWYFGQDPAARKEPFRQLLLHQPEWMQGRSVEEIVRGQRVAVSITLRAGVYLENSPTGQEALRFFQAQIPVARTTTFFIYDFRDR